MELLQQKVDHHVATITLKNPPANVLSTALLQQLDDVLTSIEKDSHIHVIVLHGEGRFFAAGADINEFTSLQKEEDFVQLARKGQQLFDRIEHFSKPIIAAIHGAALGGGLELALACHIRLATEDAKLGLPELQLGLIPGFAGTQRLPRYVGVAKAAEMILTSESITGKEAVYMGLINSTHTERSLMTEAYTLAEKIAAQSTITVKKILQLLRYSASGKIAEGIEKEAQLFGKVFMTEDAKEGISAFFEKRKPQFKNR